MLGFSVSMLLFLSPRLMMFQRQRSKRHLYSTANLISSTKSSTVKMIQALLTKRKKRVEYGQVIVEGPRMVTDLYNNKKTRPLVQKILVSADKWETYSKQFDDDDTLLLPATPEVLKSCTDTVTNQGIIAICEIPQYDISENGNLSRLFLVLDDLQDPGNLGTLLRSSVATGVAGVFLLPGSCDPWNPKAVRSAMGTTFQVPVIQTSSWDDCQQQLEAAGCNKIWAATMSDDGYDSPAAVGKPHFSVDWVSESCALVIGNEGNGLTPALRQAIRDQQIQVVHVPMQPGVESLNAAVCGSVILFEYYRQWQSHTM